MKIKYNKRTSLVKIQLYCLFNKHIDFDQLSYHRVSVTCRLPYSSVACWTCFTLKRNNIWFITRFLCHGTALCLLGQFN